MEKYNIVIEERNSGKIRGLEKQIERLQDEIQHLRTARDYFEDKYFNLRKEMEEKYIIGVDYGKKDSVEYYSVLVKYATYNFEGTKYKHCKYFRNVKFVNGRLSDNLEIDIKTMGNNSVVLEYVDVTIEDETKRSYIGVPFPSGGIFTITDIL